MDWPRRGVGGISKPLNPRPPQIKRNKNRTPEKIFPPKKERVKLRTILHYPHKTATLPSWTASLFI